jgi:hypothetical protein
MAEENKQHETEKQSQKQNQSQPQKPEQPPAQANVPEEEVIAYSEPSDGSGGTVDRGTTN